MTTTSRVRLCSLMDLPLRGGRLFVEVVSGVDVLVFKLGPGKLVAWDAACPHAGAQLRPENEMSGLITCALHQWRFDIETGICPEIPRCRMTPYELEVDGMEVYVTIPQPVTP